ncbi:MAG: HAD-IA family hydrolase [Verrucomicrobiota bacterium]|nr:HAD-IA family hydrolase [Verrucomicrobiota bacterium]
MEGRKSGLRHRRRGGPLLRVAADRFSGAECGNKAAAGAAHNENCRRGLTRATGAGILPAMATIRGVIFEMDGVLVDTERYICEAAIRMFVERGLTVTPEDFRPFVGEGENRYLGGVAERYRFRLDLERDKARTYEIYGELVAGRLEPLPGAREFIAACRARALRLALATSADRVKMLINLREANLPPRVFDATVNGQEVARAKPAPEIFLLAAQRLGMPTGACLVVEDAVNGVKAAKAAGARCLALTGAFTREQLAGADFYAVSLAVAPPEAVQW